LRLNLKFLWCNKPKKGFEIIAHHTKLSQYRIFLEKT
jgi:hypothetical protein